MNDAYFVTFENEYILLMSTISLMSGVVDLHFSCVPPLIDETRFLMVKYLNGFSKLNLSGITINKILFIFMMSYELPLKSNYQCHIFRGV